jgi:DNA modification methylase
MGMKMDLAHLPVDASWSFSNCTRKQTRYITHGYYSYPAKFIPQLAARLIKELTVEGDVIADPFMGSGTTIVEAIVNSRRAIGVDINPVAYLASKVKSTPLDPNLLDLEFRSLIADLEAQIGGDARRRRAAHLQSLPDHERIDYWFPKRQKERLGIILARVSEIGNENQRDFFLVAFAQILKTCSIWLQKSIKPTRDPRKNPADPFQAFRRQARYMLRQNADFWNTIPAAMRDQIAAFRQVKCADARALPIASAEVNLIVTSPPYVTSYEYADLHQLAALWFEYFETLPEFRKRFIGSAYPSRASDQSESALAEKICAELGNTKKSREVRGYFADMLACFREMKRVLKTGGKVCIVIGNTEFQGVAILNAQVFAEQMQNIGLSTRNVIKRHVSSKILPQTRDPENGRFTSTANSDRVLAYPVEYILVMEKID